MLFSSEDLKENNDTSSISLGPLQELIGGQDPQKMEIESNTLNLSQFRLDKTTEGEMNLSLPPEEFQQPDKIEEKRKKGRLRSKMSRERRKAYILGLENKVKSLESEVFRLQNLLINYRKENLEQVHAKSKTLMTDLNQQRIDVIEKFDVLTDSKEKEKEDPKLCEGYQPHQLFAIKRHRKFLDRVFEMIINHPYPVARFSYWKSLDSEYTTSFETIKKMNKLTKYQMNDFVKEHGLTELDQYIASFNPSKRQFEYIKNISLKREYEIKQKFKEGIKLLLKAKEIFQEYSCKLYASTALMLKCQILSDKEIAKSKIRDSFMSDEDAFTNIWKVKVEPKNYSIDLAKDPLYGRLARRYMKRADHIINIEYSNFTLE